MGEGKSQEAYFDAQAAPWTGKIMTAIVRLATRNDKPDLVALCHELHADNGLFPMDEEMVDEMLERAFNRRGGIIGVIDGDDKIAACIYILISNFWYSRQNHLEELFSFVRPEHRKSKHAATLIEFAQKCASQLKLKLLIGVLTTHRMESKVRLYRRELGMPAGAFFVYEPDGIPSQHEGFDGAWRILYEHSRGRNKKGELEHSVMTTTPLPMLPLVQTNGAG